MLKVIIAIDPGSVSGGIAWQDTDGRVFADSMPEGLSEIYSYLKGLVVMVDRECVIERVGTYVKGNAGPAAATFARHCGHLDAILYALSIPVVDNPTPGQWMKAMGVPKFTGTPARQKQLRKNWIKDKVSRRFPHLKVTLSTSDALGLLAYYLDKKK
jgi:hypothetical protein